MTTTSSSVAAVADTAALAAAVIDEVERAVVGKRAVLELVMAALLADGHVLLDDLPGVAKTLTARSLATVLGLSFNRVQFTPDLLPADITGSTLFEGARPAFHPGPVFTQLLLADEINRAPAKTQAALLEAMQERQVTADGITHRLPRPFLVIATENPIESEGTYPLPEAQLDRFITRTRLGYPSITDETEMLRRRLARGTDDVVLRPVTTPAAFVAAQLALEKVQVDQVVGSYIVAIVTATRHQSDLEVGASPRGSLALLKMARAHAALRGRDFVTPDDVRAVAVPSLAHRVVLRSDAWVRRVSPDELVARIVDTVAAPSWN